MDRESDPPAPRRPALSLHPLTACGIDADNYASQRCALAAGFHVVDPRPDYEQMLYYRREHPH